MMMLMMMMCGSGGRMMAGFFVAKDTMLHCVHFHATEEALAVPKGSKSQASMVCTTKHIRKTHKHTQETFYVIRLPLCPPRYPPPLPGQPYNNSAPTAQGVAGSLEWDAGSRAGRDAMSAGYSKGGRFCLTSSKKMAMLDRLCLGLLSVCRNEEEWGGHGQPSGGRVFLMGNVGFGLVDG
jgi:hypothetical protein